VQARPALAVLALAASGLLLIGCRCNRSSETEPSANGAASEDEPKAMPPPYYLRRTARAGDTTLVAWHGQGKVNGVRAVRVGANGKILDATPIAVSANPHDADIAVAAYDGGFWVAWEHFPEGPGVHIQGLRISTAGKLLDETPRLLTGPDETQRSPSVSCGQKDCLLLFHDFREGSYGSLRALHLGPGGIPSKHFAFAGKSHRSSAVATTRGGYLVAFSGGLKPDRYDIHTLAVPFDGTTLTEAGTPLTEAGATLPEPKLVAESDRASGVRLACNDDQCFVAWLSSVKVQGGPRHREVGGMRVYVTPSRSEIWGCRLQTDGSVAKGAAPIKLRELPTGPSRVESLALSATASDFVLTWQGTAFGEGGRSTAGVLRIESSGKAEELEIPPARDKLGAVGGGWLAALVKHAEPSDWLLTTRLGADNTAQWAVQPLPPP
jgi:hypothetical protein